MGDLPRSTGARPALAGVTVLELGDRIAVGACGGLLAQLGATVLLAEPEGVSARGKWLNRPVTSSGKQSLAPQAVQEMLGTADVVLFSTDLDPQQLAAWGTLSAERLVLCDITAFGHDGPMAGLPYSEALVAACSGVAAATGRRQGAPALTGAPFLEMETAVYAAAAVVAALRSRRHHGTGQRIDIAIYDVAVNALGAFLPLTLTGRPAVRNGNRHPTLSPWNVYQASDGWIVVCAPTNELWRRLAGAMGRPELVHDVRFATPTARMDNVDAVDDVVTAWAQQYGARECLDALGEAVIPSGPITEIAQLAEEANLRHRGALQHAFDPVGRSWVDVPGPVIRELGTGRPATIPLPRSISTPAFSSIASSTAKGAPQPGAAMTSSGGVLDGVRVIEIGMNTVGPLAGRQLGALGADVIKVEPPGGESNRANAPLRDDGESYIFAISNTDKSGVVLDLRNEDDRSALWTLLESADVLIENLKPGSLARLGFGADEVRARLPGLVYCSVNGFGHDSAYPGRPALDTVVQAMSAAMAVTVVDGVPTKAGISVADQLGGQFGLLGVLAALELRDRTGEGATLDLAMQDAVAWATCMLWNAPSPETRRALRGGEVLAARDGYVVTGIGDGHAGANLTQDLAQDLTVAEVVTALRGRGILAEPVIALDDVLEQEQTAARGLILSRATRRGDEWTVLGSPLRLEATPARVRCVMGRLGEDQPYGVPRQRRVVAAGNAQVRDA